MERTEKQHKRIWYAVYPSSRIGHDDDDEEEDNDNNVAAIGLWLSCPYRKTNTTTKSSMNYGDLYNLWSNT